MNAAIYVRISRDRKVEEDEERALGVKRQEEDCRLLAERNGWAVQDVYADNDISAYSGKRRPAYERMLADIADGAVNAVIAWHPDRLHRSMLELLPFMNLCQERGVQVQTARAGIIDLNTPSGQMIARTLGNMAQYESDQKADRQRRKHTELAKAGKRSGGGPRPFGLTEKWDAVVEHEVALIREAADRLLSGESLRGVALDWQARGILTSTGAAWRGENLKQMICSPRIAGLRSHLGKITAQGEWPALLDRGTWERLTGIVCGKGGTRAPTRSQYLLTRIARCGKCNGPMYGKKLDNDRLTYICPAPPRGCGAIKIGLTGLDDLISESLFTALDSPELAAAISQRQQEGGADDARQLRADEAALEQLSRDHYFDNLIGRSEFLAARDALSERIEADRGRLARREQGDPLAANVGAGKQVRAAWAQRDVAWRRALLAAVIDRIEIGPGKRGLNRFDPSRVSIEWRY